MTMVAGVSSARGSYGGAKGDKKQQTNAAECNFVASIKYHYFCMAALIISLV